MTRVRLSLPIGLVLAIALAWGASPGIRAAASMAGPTLSADTAAAAAAPATVSVAAAPAKAAAPQGRATKASAAQKQQTVTDVAGRKHVRMKRVTPAERQAAANRLKARTAAAAGAAAKATAPATAAAMAAPLAAAAAAPGMGAMALSTALPGAIPRSQLRVASNGQLVPDYSGLTPNWAYSPAPSVAPAGLPTVAGHPTTSDRQYATDFPVGVGQVGMALVVIPSAVLPAGNLTGFQTWNQTAIGGSPFPSAGNVFHAYVLRPTGVANQYSVVFDSGPLTVPAPANSAGEVATFPVGPVAVLAGDVIGFHGQGIPLDTGGTNADILSYPVPTPPAIGGLIDIGSATYPQYSLDRTYALSATVEVPGTTITGGIRKFVDTLPGLNTPNNLGQQIPVAVPDTTTFPGADYYEIELGQYTEKMHSDLPPTTLRGYRQANMGGAPFHYLGPLIVAQKGRPVRVKFTNNLPTGAAGNLFLPVDASVMGAGPGSNVADATRTAIEANDLCKAAAGQAVPAGCYTQNRATIHLHGGVTPWISDGTTHQWITPAGESTAYPEGVSVYNVPDMLNPGKPGTASNPAGSGSQTFYYTNDQSARLMFYHDHAAGITRLNVYAGVAAGYLLTDPTEQELVAKNIIPADQIPLVIQDKTFVDAANIGVQDPTWNWGTGPASLYTDPTDPTRSMQLRTPNTGDLWWPHVYMPAQNPYDLSGYNAMGRWNYGPWFFPPTPIPFGPIPNPYCGGPVGGPCTDPAQPAQVPGTPNPSWGAEAFLDTPVINGTLYPTVTVAPKAYRFRILNAAHDRFWNLQLYKADSTVPPGCPTCAANSEVRMVPAAPGAGLPANWPQDGREGGAPDPAAVGPSWIQIGTEGGFLPKPVVVPNQPVLWNNDPLTFNFGNVSDHSLLLGPAERADVIVDFSAYAGQTLILYNDAPAAFPASDPRNDYYTGNPDQTDTGGTVSTLPGFGPNTRTIMQIKVDAAAPAPAFNLSALTNAWAPGSTGFTWSPAGVFEHAQDRIIVGQAAYNGVYTLNPAFRSDPPWGMGTIFSPNVSFETVDGTQLTMASKEKAIHDEMGATFDDYGRMKASLGVSMPNPTPLTANFIMQGYADPTTEVVKMSDIATMIGDPLADGTQIWRINHNGVDTHPIHFHLFHVQLINRVGWDGAYRLPDATELGWKDTVRVSPLEDTYVALRPIAPGPATLPFKVPNSFRPLEPALPIGSPLGFSNVDPLGNPITPGLTNQVYNFGWEYVWHCHILSHEENDMMRAVTFTAPPEAPTGLALVGPRAAAVSLTWMDNSVSATSFILERAADAAFTTGVTTVTLPVTPCAVQAGCARTFTDNTTQLTTAYFYRVRASNTVGTTVPNYPTITVQSALSNVASIPAGVPPITAPTNLVATIASGPTRIVLTWTDASNNENSFAVWRSTNGAAFVQVGTVTRNNAQRTGTGGTVTFNNTGLTAGSTYRYYVTAVVTGVGASNPSNTVTVLFAAPAAPTGLAGAAVRITGNLLQDRVTLTWTDASGNEASFEVQRSTTAAFNNPTSYTVGANTTTFSQNVSRLVDYYYRVRAVNAVGNSAWSNAVFVVTP
jgi:FtsP/CotA-like multicopper oxidase with cupredoxin domain